MNRAQETSTSPEATRRYRMGARREAVARTRERILAAAHELWVTERYDGITMEQVADTAGVSRQTVYRHFGSKQELVLAAAEWAHLHEEEARRVDPGDVEGAVRRLVERYEQMGDANVRALELEGYVPEMRTVLDGARRSHRGWIEGVFSEYLAPLSPEQREEAVLALWAANDVMVWKLLRRDLGRSVPETEAVLRRLTEGVLHTLRATEEETP